MHNKIINITLKVTNNTVGAIRPTLCDVLSFPIQVKEPDSHEAATSRDTDYGEKNTNKLQENSSDFCKILILILQMYK